MKKILVFTLLFFIISCSDYSYGFQISIMFIQIPNFESQKSRNASDEITSRIFNVLSKHDYQCIEGDYIKHCLRNLSNGDDIIIEIIKSNKPNEVKLNIKGHDYAPFLTTRSPRFLEKLEYWREVINVSSDTMLDYDVTYGRSFICSQKLTRCSNVTGFTLSFKPEP